MESKSTKDKKFDSIYRAYKDSIFKVAMHYAKCEDLANEITQKTFFQLYIYFENVNLDNVYPWLVQPLEILRLITIEIKSVRY